MITEAYKMQLVQDEDGQRLIVDGPHTLRMFRPDTAATAPTILLSGNICWVRSEDVGAVKAALEAQDERVSGEGVPLPTVPGSAGAA